MKNGKRNQKVEKPKEDFFEVSEDIWETQVEKVKPKLLNRLSVIPAVLIPEGGESYNPSQKDYIKKIQRVTKVKDNQPKANQNKKNRISEKVKEIR